MQSIAFGSRSSRHYLLLGVGLIVLMAAGIYTLRLRNTSDRQAQVAARGAEVMPFDLDRTMHVFAPLADGGRQTITAKDPTDAHEIALIRGHLQAEAEKFRRGDFGDPATIHGDAMPGLAALRAGASRIDVRYRDLPDGAELRYTTQDEDLVRALHAWFAAQVSDHGKHADHE